MKNLRYFTLIILTLAVFACSGPQENPRETRSSSVEFDPDLCKEQIGYDRGYNDGLAGRTVDSSFSLRCREDLREMVVKAYRDGYDKGTAQYKAKQDRDFKYYKINNRRAQTPRDTTPPPTTPPEDQGGYGSNNRIFNINIGKGSQNTNPTPNPAPQTPTVNQKAFYCTVTAFMNDFSAYGPTELEAKNEVIRQCSAKYHKMHCEDVECQPNR